MNRVPWRKMALVLCRGRPGGGRPKAGRPVQGLRGSEGRPKSDSNRQGRPSDLTALAPPLAHSALATLATWLFLDCPDMLLLQGLSVCRFLHQEHSSPIAYMPPFPLPAGLCLLGTFLVRPLLTTHLVTPLTC